MGVCEGGDGGGEDERMDLDDTPSDLGTSESSDTTVKRIAC